MPADQQLSSSIISMSVYGVQSQVYLQTKQIELLADVSMRLVALLHL